MTVIVYDSGNSGNDDGRDDGGDNDINFDDHVCDGDYEDGSQVDDQMVMKWSWG